VAANNTITGENNSHDCDDYEMDMDLHTQNVPITDNSSSIYKIRYIHTLSNITFHLVLYIVIGNRILCSSDYCAIEFEISIDR
jgi:hypothetical protein